MKKFLRILAILLAVYFLVTAFANMFGFLSSGFSATGIAARFRQSFVSIVAGILLLVDPKKLKQGAASFVYFVGLFAANIFYSLAYVSQSRLLMNVKKPAALALSLLILTILWGTFWYGLSDRFSRTSRK